MNRNYKEAFEKTRVAGIVAAGALEEVAKIAKPGTRTEQIDNLCYEYLNDMEATRLTFLELSKSASANHIVCHGIPSDKILKKEILST